MRTAGILMAISSLPSPWGVGTMGKAAREFVDFLSRAGQRYWQILPIGPTGFGDSPYQSFSSYAGNPYLIDLDELEREGLLRREEYCELDWGSQADRVDYGLIYRNRFTVLRKSARRVRGRQGSDLLAFCQREKKWLEDYALYMALKEDNGGASWFQWPEALRLRQEQALARAREELAEEIDFWKTVQYLFYRQWNALHQYAKQKNVLIIGDLPIYVAADSVDVWAEPGQFCLDEMGKPTLVAGCPPDGFSADGQLWGNPIFRWDVMKKEGYHWWLDRLSYQFKIYDVLRIDHFRGFDSYYAIAYGEKTARNGRWLQGPGKEFFRVVRQKLGDRPLIAEDLGYLTQSVIELLEDTGYPGMKVLEFGFDSRDESGSDYLPYQCHRNSVVYTGTHDNDTIIGWLNTMDPADADYAKRYLRLTEEEGWNWGMMREAWATQSDLAIMQMQDILGLGSEARMNTPSTLGGNWQWRALPGAYNEELASRLRLEMKTYHRLWREK